jgi:glucose-1-phosphate cytidylyltransferase
MKCVILAGGKGTRIAEESATRPKPMVEIGSRPILWHIMKLYAEQGFRDFVLCLGYRGNMIKEYFLNYEAMNSDFTICLGNGSQIKYHGDHGEQGFAVTLAETGGESMTGGRLKRVAKYLENEERFIATYGDGLGDVNLQELAVRNFGHRRIAEGHDV